MVLGDIKRGGVSVFDGNYTLKLSRDRLAAVLRPKEGESLDWSVDMDKLRAEVIEAGVEFGLLPQFIKRDDGTYLVAQGTSPRNGHKATVKVHVKPSVVRTPKVAKPGRETVDYKELGSIVNVKTGQLLLEKIPPTSGTPGKDVLGTELPARPGKDFKLRVGKGTTISEDAMKIHSSLEGKFVTVDGKPCVFEEHTVSGDVDMSVGNLDFVGKKLNIRRSVLPGFKVRCVGNINIDNAINSALVIANGNMTVGNIVGEDAVVKAKGDLCVGFIENVSAVETKGELVVKDYIIQTRVKVGGNLKALQGKGAIIGGKYVVGGSMYVKELGSEAEVVTEVSVGIDPELEEKRRKMLEEKEIWPQKMNEVIKNLSALKQMKKQSGGKLPPDKAKLVNNLNAVLPKIMEQVSRIEEMEKQFEEEKKQMINESIYVYGKLYPGVKVSIGGVSRIITDKEDTAIISFNPQLKQPIHIRPMSGDEIAEAGQLDS
ncbi:MAG: DUF342 domain-containing protein [Desulfobulbaceae bacterium]|nr:DUF342 domain-containing protein [Desulfobulbaceae bacterium]MCK5543681.1 DUF342 domain-containing protein [Desulfobulbaceae bacterium]